MTYKTLQKMTLLKCEEIDFLFTSAIRLIGKDKTSSINIIMEPHLEVSPSGRRLSQAELMLKECKNSNRVIMEAFLRNGASPHIGSN